LSLRFPVREPKISSTAGTLYTIELKMNNILTDHHDIINELIDKEKFKATKIEPHTILLG